MSDATSRPLRIAIWHNLPSGGAKRALFDHIKYLVNACGHHVEAWCPDIANRTFLPLSALIEEHVLPIPITPRAKWMKRLASSGRVDIALLERLDAMEAHCRLAGAEIAVGHFDVLLSGSCQWFHAPAIGRHVSIPSAAYLGEPSRDLYEAGYAHRRTLRWLAEEPLEGVPVWHPRALRYWVGAAARVHPYRVQAREELMKMKSFDRILVNSYFTRESVMRAYGLGADVCYLGIDTRHFRPGDVPREDFVLMVGAFGFHKNPEFLIRSLALTRTMPRLVWVANHVDDTELGHARQLASTLGVSLDVMANLGEADLLRLYQTARLMLYAPRLEPFGLAPLEANACATPVVAAAEGGLRETVQDGVTGYLVAPRVESVAAAIDQLIEHPALARKLGEQAVAIVRERWTTEAAGMRLDTALRELLASTGGRGSQPQSDRAT